MDTQSRILQSVEEAQHTFEDEILPKAWKAYTGSLEDEGYTAELIGDYGEEYRDRFTGAKKVDGEGDTDKYTLATRNMIDNGTKPTYFDLIAIDSFRPHDLSEDLDIIPTEKYRCFNFAYDTGSELMFRNFVEEGVTRALEESNVEFDIKDNTASYDIHVPVED